MINTIIDFFKNDAFATKEWWLISIFLLIVELAVCLAIEKRNGGDYAYFLFMSVIINTVFGGIVSYIVMMLIILYVIVNTPLFIIAGIKYYIDNKTKIPINKVKLLCTIDDMGQVINYIVKEDKNELVLSKYDLILATDIKEYLENGKLTWSYVRFTPTSHIELTVSELNKAKNHQIVEIT